MLPERRRSVSADSVLAQYRTERQGQVQHFHRDAVIHFRRGLACDLRAGKFQEKNMTMNPTQKHPEIGRAHV